MCLTRFPLELPFCVIMWHHVGAGLLNEMVILNS